MDCVYLLSASYVDGFEVDLKFNTGESGRVDLKDVIFRNEAAEALRDPKVFSEFYLDSWPTLAWKCGFDIAPETLYEKLTNHTRYEHLDDASLKVAEDPAEYGSRRH
ncbi:MAG: DUF2442 domain-containing protein [Verrucomicrobiota bacterium]|nr:DUF2442 domain-containing protein [Verrucomicrobiota bacterium]